jgi:competence protein ComEA
LKDRLASHSNQLFEEFFMFKKLLAFFAAMTVAVAFAAVDVNKATPAELDGIKGIGPAVSGKIIDERKKGNFKSWEDFIARVKGIGEGNAAKFSAEGLTVGGAGYKGAAAPAKKDGQTAKPAAAAKADMKTDAKPAAAPTAAAAPAKADTKPVAAAAPTAKPDAKTDAAKPAASAAKK